MEGQYNIMDYIKPEPLHPTKADLDKRYDIPRDHQKEEGWTDDWHYTELENPKESGVYFVIELSKYGNYMYTYQAWAFGHWWWFDSYTKKYHRISDVCFAHRKPFAWVTVPNSYYRDPSYNEHCDYVLDLAEENKWFEEQDNHRRARKEGRWE